MKKYISITILISSLVTLAGCQSQDDGAIAERARLEGKSQAEEQLKKDRELLEDETRKQKELQDRQAKTDRDLQSEQIKKQQGSVDARAKVMEKSLSKLQDFYEDNSGVYEGTMDRGTDKFAIRITLYPSIPRYADSRVRTPTEIETDLTALAYNAQILQWIPPNKDSVGCRINGLKPNTKKGTLNIISPDCPSSYFLVLNRTAISGTAQSENNSDPLEIYAERTAKSARAPAKKVRK